MAKPLLSVRISQEMMDEIDRAASALEIDRSEFAVVAIAEKLGNKKFLPVSKQIEDIDRRLTLIEDKISVLVEN
jgi:metal-responsive CopG/Arc/MetJ family transcriptional regulator